MPPAAYVCVALAVVTAGDASPKSQLYDVALVEVFVNVHVRPVQL
jgi:hypothetical protein